MDTSIIELCIKVFYWARFQRTKGAVKLHLQLDHQGCLPCCAFVTVGDTNVVRIAQQLQFAPGTIVVLDRGYLDYALYVRCTDCALFFVTPPRTNMLYKVTERPTLPTLVNLTLDETIKLTS